MALLYSTVPYRTVPARYRIEENGTVPYWTVKQTFGDTPRYHYTVLQTRTVPYRGIYYVRWLLVRGHISRAAAPVAKKFVPECSLALVLTGCSPNFGGLPYYTLWAGRRPLTLSRSMGGSCCVAGVIFLVVELACWTTYIVIADWGAFFFKFVIYPIFPCIILLWVPVFFSKYKIYVSMYRFSLIVADSLYSAK